MSFQEIAEAYLIPAQLAAAMFGMGATLRIQDFVEVFKQPVSLGIGVCLQMIGVPLIAWTFAELFGMSPGWAVGIVLVSVVPGGAFSNLLTFLGRGNTALSIAMTVAATASCIITIPLILSILAPSHLPADFQLPASKIVFDIFAWLLSPLALGMVVYRMVSEETAAAIARWSVRLALVLLATIVISSLGSGRIKVPEYGWIPPLRIVLFCAVLAIGLPHVCRLLGRYDEDTVAIGIEVCVRNVGVALLIFNFFFPGEEAQGHVLYSLLFYSGISAFFAVPQVIVHRMGKSAVFGRRAYQNPESAPSS